MSKKHRDYDAADQHAATQPAEPSPADRAKDLLKSMTEAQKHNAPVTPLMLSEVGALVAHVSGEQVAKPLHPILDERGQPKVVTFRKPDGTVEMIDTAEEALAFVRSLPEDVQAKPHFVAADKALEEAVASVPGSDISPGIRAFESALTTERDAMPRHVDIPPKPESLQPKPPQPQPEPATEYRG